VLMAADILAFDANQVPVGRDQIQHIEMARDLGQRFNHIHGHDFFVLPEALIEEQVATLPGLDGRKMSKSYDNTIPLFAGGKKQLRETIMRIVTDSRLPGEPKDPDISALFTIFRGFANEAETAAFRQALLEGMSWGDAKQALFERIETDVAPMRERYEVLMEDPTGIETILQQGAVKARAIATPKLAELRAALGLRSAGSTTSAVSRAKAKPKAGKMPRFASFRDAEGRFRFRLFGADGDELLLSMAFDDPKTAGALQKQIKNLGATAAVMQMADAGMHLELGGKAVASTPDYADEQARDQALAKLYEALDQLAAQD
jgi:tryptophanyl-tRNA synthetase